MIAPSAQWWAVDLPEFVAPLHFSAFLSRRSHLLTTLRVSRELLPNRLTRRRGLWSLIQERSRSCLHQTSSLCGGQSGDDRPKSGMAADERVFRPTLLHLADRIGARPRAKAKAGRTVTARVRFANLDSTIRSVTLDAPISASVILAEIAEELVRAVLADHPDEKTISLLAISVSHLEEHWDVQLELPLGLKDEARRPGTKKGMARWAADCADDSIRDRFGWDAIGYASVALGISRSVPDEFRKLAEKDL